MGRFEIKNLKILPDYRKILLQSNKEIATLLLNPEMLSVLGKYQSTYVHWDELRLKKLPSKIKPELLWAVIKLFRALSSKQIFFGPWQLIYTIPEEFYSLLLTSDKMGHFQDDGFIFQSKKLPNPKIEQPSNSLPFSKPLRTQFIIESLMEEAINSSQIEGAVTTTKIAREMLLKHRKPKNYSERMIFNGYQTMQLILTLNQLTITPEILLQLHTNITQKTLKDSKFEGKFRENNDVVVSNPLDGQIYHVPPDYHQIPDLMREFCQFASEDTSPFIHPIIKGIILHYLLAYIHPFEDGNGRTARTVFYWYVLSRGYNWFGYIPISRLILRSRGRYAKAYLYTESDENDLTYFIKFNLQIIQEALDDIRVNFSQKQQNQQELLNFVEKEPNLNLRQAEILQSLKKSQNQMVEIKEVVNTFGVAYDTARNDLLGLVTKGYLRQLNIKKKFVFLLTDNTINQTEKSQNQENVEKK